MHVFFQRSTIVMYYNKEAFREAGLDPNRPPATWAEMAEAGKRLTKKDAAGNVTRWGVMHARRDQVTGETRL